VGCSGGALQGPRRHGGRPWAQVSNRVQECRSAGGHYADKCASNKLQTNLKCKSILRYCERNKCRGNYPLR